MRKLFILAALGGLMLMVALSSVPSVAAADAWWDADYPYRVPVTINGGGAGTYENDLEIFFRIDNQDNLNNHLASDNFNDLRFVTAGLVEMNYYVEARKDGDWADVWVQMPNDNTLDNFYCYYGYSGAAPVSSAEDTFILFENFFTLGAKFPERRNVGNISSDGENLRLEANDTGVRSNLVLKDDVEVSIRWTYDDQGQADLGFRDAAGAWQHQMEGAGEDGSIFFTTIAGACFVETTDGSGSSDQRNYPGSSDVTKNYWFVDNFVFDATNYVQHTHREFEGAGSTISYKATSNIPNSAASMEVELYRFGGGGVHFYDWVRVRNWDNLDNQKTTLTLGAEEVTTATLGNIRLVSLDTTAGPSEVVDRDDDGYLLSSEDDRVRIRWDVYDNYGWDNIHSYITIRDNNGAVIVDNDNVVSPSKIDDNTARFVRVYNPPDATTDDNCGGWSVEIYMYSIASGLDNDWAENALFIVDDLFFDNLGYENLAGHKTRIFGEVGRVSGIPTSTVSVTVSDNNAAPITICTGGDNVFENTYTGRFGQWWAYANDNCGLGEPLDAAMDPATDNEVYLYPNLPVGFVSVAVDNVLIDNHASDNAITQTQITMIFEDNDNCEFGEFYIALRGDDDALIDNRLVTYSCENSNRALVTMLYDAEDNNLADAALGDFDVWGVAYDNWSEAAGWNSSVFVVDDYAVPIVFTPENTLMGFAVGFDITAAGTPTRDSGAAASVDSGSLVDAIEGTIVLGAGAYSETYSIDGSEPGDTVTVTVTIYDGPLDGQAENTYTITDNRIYYWHVYAEDNGLAPYNFDPLRTYTLTAYYDNGWGYSENVTQQNGEIVVNAPIRNITLSDNALYLRTLIPENITDNLSFYLVQDNANRPLVYQYIYTLEDYTGVYGYPNPGELHIERLVDNVLIEINADWWDSDGGSPAWLLYNYQHQYTIRNDTLGRSFVAAHFYTTTDLTRTLTVRPPVEENLHILYNIIRWGAYRDGQSVFVTYNDTAENTENVTINIYEWGTTTSLYTYNTTVLQTFLIEWNGGENGKSYTVRINATVTNENIGTFSEARSVGPNLAGYTVDDPEGGGFLGGPIPLVGVGSMVALLIISLSFGARYDVQGMFAITLGAAMFRLIGWLPVDWAVIGFLFVLSLVWALGKGASRG